jgi:hypothetical protein
MSFRRRALLAAVAVLGAVVMSPVAAHAADTFQECVDRAAEHDGTPPTCTEVDGGFVASWPDDTLGGSGGTSAIVFLVVICALLTVALIVWQVSTARRLATASGMDPDLATQMTLLTDNGLESTYLASALRQPSAAPAATPVSAASRLAELRSLLDAGVITQQEHDVRRTAIIDSL